MRDTSEVAEFSRRVQRMAIGLTGRTLMGIRV